MEKVDYKKKYKDLYTASTGKPKLIDVPKFNFLMTDGCGDPQISPVFQEAIQALYSLTYTAKFMFKEDKSLPEYVVPPLEGLWYADDISVFDKCQKDKWQWTLMVLQPEWFTSKVLQNVKKVVKEKKESSSLLDKVRLETFEEGKSAQIMHVGPYDAVRPTIEKLFSFIEGQRHTLRGKHHEIYLSDPRRTAPQKLKTIIRHPVK
jgi:hypothetical protein